MVSVSSRAGLISVLQSTELQHRYSVHKVTAFPCMLATATEHCLVKIVTILGYPTGHSTFSSRAAHVSAHRQQYRVDALCRWALHAWALDAGS